MTVMLALRGKLPAHSNDNGGLKPTDSQRAWLQRGLEQPGGKLPLFDRDGRKVNLRTVKSCVEAGWAEPWFVNPIKPDWEVCKLTRAGRRIATQHDG